MGKLDFSPTAPSTNPSQAMGGRVFYPWAKLQTCLVPVGTEVTSVTLVWPEAIWAWTKQEGLSGHTDNLSWRISLTVFKSFMTGHHNHMEFGGVFHINFSNSLIRRTFSTLELPANNTNCSVVAWCVAAGNSREFCMLAAGIPPTPTLQGINIPYILQRPLPFHEGEGFSLPWPFYWTSYPLSSLLPNLLLHLLIFFSFLNDT